MKKFDIVIITKDRYKLALEQVRRCMKYIPYNNIIVVDSTDKNNDYPFQVSVFHTPNVKLGEARKIGTEKVKTKYFYMFDDDVKFNEKTVIDMYSSMLQNPNALALSPNLIYGNNDEIKNISVYKKPTGHYAVSGSCIINNDYLKEAKGFNPKLHVGEDIELALRSKNYYNHAWLIDYNIRALHPISDRDFMFRRWNQLKASDGLKYYMLYSELTIFRIFVRRCVSILYYPLYYLCSTRNIKTFLISASYRVLEMLQFILRLRNVFE